MLSEQTLLGVELTVLEVQAQTPDSVSIAFDVDPATGAALPFLPGQYLTLRIPSEQTGSVARCYSIATSPDDGSPLTVVVKRTLGGYGSNWLCDHAEAGMRLRTLAPAGRFTPSSWDADLFLFAGGSGITPVMSILRTALSRGAGRVALFYANRNAESVIFRAALDDLVTAYPDRLRVEHWLEDRRGIPTAEALRTFAEADRGGDAPREAYLCGPKPFMALVADTLTADADTWRRVCIEEFSSIEGDPFVLESASVDAPANATDGSRDAGGTTVTIRLTGRQHTLTCPPGGRILDAVLRAGIPAPYSCREGECGTCIAHLDAGSVEMAATDALAPEDIDAGFVLACQSRPTSPAVELDFDA